MRRADAVASLDKPLPDEPRATSSKTRSTSNFRCRMNAALLKSTSICPGTSFCRVVPIGCVSHPNQLSAPSQFLFLSSQQPLKDLSLRSGTPFLIFQRQKVTVGFPPKKAPQTQVP